MQRSSEWDDTGRNVVIDDMVAMLTSTVSTASVVAKSLEELSHHVGIEVLLLNIDESTFLVKDNMECK